jgi:hypothetical protein
MSVWARKLSYTVIKNLADRVKTLCRNGNKQVSHPTNPMGDIYMREGREL